MFIFCMHINLNKSAYLQNPKRRKLKDLEFRRFRSNLSSYLIKIKEHCRHSVAAYNCSELFSTQVHFTVAHNYKTTSKPYIHCVRKSYLATKVIFRQVGCFHHYICYHNWLFTQYNLCRMTARQG